MAQDLGWKELPEGDILKAGSATQFHTGDWRSKRPVKDEKTCINCLFCYIYCPDSAIHAKDGKMTDIDFNYCKGCGICETVCPVKPVKAIKMVSER
ncbi:MAG: 4Fe-4S dicluster-binding protein [Candidatus Margulisiibacteriota bacterium]